MYYSTIWLKNIFSNEPTKRLYHNYLTTWYKIKVKVLINSVAHAQSDSVNLLTGKWRCFIFSCWTCCCCCCHSYRCCCRHRRCYWNVGCSTFLEFLEALTKTFCSGEDYKTSQPEMNVFLKLNLKLAMESFIVVVRFFFLFNRGSASFIGGPFRSESTHTHALNMITMKL